VKKILGLVLLVWLFGGMIAGFASALTVYKAEFDYHIFDGDDAYNVYTVVDEPANFSDVTLFCPLDAYDATNNVTPCYYEGSIVNATIYFNSTTGYPKLVSGRIGNAFEFDGNSGEEVHIPATLNDITSISITLRVKVIDPDKLGALTVFETDGLAIPILGIGYGNIRARGADAKMYNVVQAVAGQEYMITYIIENDFANNKLIYRVYINDALLAWQKEFDGATTFNVTNFYIGYYNQYNPTPKAVTDEFRVYVNKTLTQDEIKLLYYAGRKKLSEPASLAVSSVTYDGSKFDITVNATLPNEAQYIYIPQIATTDRTVVQNWSTGHKLIDVSGLSWTTFTIPATPGEAVPGLKYLGIETDEGIYAYGSDTMNLANPTTRPFYTSVGSVTNTINAGRVEQVSFSISDALRLIKTSGYVSLTGGAGTLKFLSHGQDYLKIDATVISPIGLSFQNLYPLMDYRILLDTNEKPSFKTDDYGKATYTLSAGGIWEIGLPKNIYESFNANIMSIITVTLIITVFVAFVVEQTPQKWDDDAAKALFALVILTLVIAVVKLILFIK